jgi:hypothetical protein
MIEVRLFSATLKRRSPLLKQGAPTDSNQSGLVCLLSLQRVQKAVSPLFGQLWLKVTQDMVLGWPPESRIVHFGVEVPQG